MAWDRIWDDTRFWTKIQQIAPELVYHFFIYKLKIVFVIEFSNMYFKLS
jgi:hypothetical protein